LPAQVLKAVEACGYKYPTPVQAQSIPPILDGKDVVASAQTGTGKTAAFVLPALALLAQNPTPQKKPRVLVLTPTRELAAQITAAAAQYGKFLNFKIVSLVGGMGYPQQLRELSRGADIVVATPGRLLDHMDSRRVDLSDVKMLVLDEADRMLDMGFIDDVRTIAKATAAQRQTLLFTATVNRQLATIIKTLLKNPVNIDFAHEALSPDAITQILYLADSAEHKTRLLEHLLAHNNIFKAIIFTSTKRHADKLAEDLREDGFSAAALHGDLKQAARNRTVDQLRRGKIQYVVATDVAARGIDISDLTHVINYDLPKFSEDYVHRIGRTGRAGKTGIAISFALPSEVRHLQKIERYTQHKIEQQTLPGLEPRKKHTSASAAPERKRSSPSRSSRGGADKAGGGRDRKFSSERSSEGRTRTFNSDKPAGTRDRKFSDARPASGSSDRPFNREKPAGTRDRKFDGERPAVARTRTFSSAKPAGATRDRKFGDARPASGSSDRPFNREKPAGATRDRKFTSEKTTGSRDRKFDGNKRPSSGAPHASDTRGNKPARASASAPRKASTTSGKKRPY